MPSEFDLRDLIRNIPDYPKPGILFRDITTLLADPEGFQAAVKGLARSVAQTPPDKVAGIEARGFIVGGAVASRLGLGFIPIRKQGKLPYNTLCETYQLEYGSDAVEIHTDAVHPGERILLVDDLMATGGTAEASIRLIRRAGGDVIHAAFIVDLPDSGGTERIEALGVPCSSLVTFKTHPPAGQSPAPFSEAGPSRKASG